LKMPASMGIRPKTKNVKILFDVKKNDLGG
jgi:hypothetical protein